MAATYSSLRSKLNRALVAYLKTVITNVSVFPANASTTKDLPHFEIIPHKGQPEVKLTGLNRIAVRILFKFQAAIQPGQNDPDANRKAMDALFAQAVDALMLSDDDQTLRATARLITTAGRSLATTGTTQSKADNADMADFTCTGWYDAGLEAGQPEGESSTWVEIANFEAACCASNVD